MTFCRCLYCYSADKCVYYFYDLVEEESWEQAEEMLNSIEAKIGENDPELNSARITLRLEQI